MFDRKNVTYMLVSGSLIAALSVYAAQRSQEASNLDFLKIQAAAVNSIGIGLSSLGNLRSAEYITIKLQDLPSALAVAMTGQQVMKVVYDSVQLWESDKRLRTLSAYADPGSGRLLRVTVTPCGFAEAGALKLGLDTTEDRLLNESICFVGFPDSQFVSFLAMIRKCPMNAPSAKRITAIYAMDSCTTSGQTEVRWIVSLTGTHPVPLVGVRGVPDSLLNRGPTAFWVIMDGRTGEPLQAGN